MSLVFPDVNVWLALAAEEHVHHARAIAWWRQEVEPIAFCRFTQIGLLRLLTTAAVMNGKPLAMRRAWKVYDGFMGDERVELAAEPPALERIFRELSSSGTRPSPKLWADAYLIAFAVEAGGMVATFDQALSRRGPALVLV
ncbi:MAG TPA: TA system VapC family ribonuclease toxin [Bryobacteraceae bacterium]